nr:class I SAM-dependent methyltransferase [Ferrimicrobium acidiphilum]
MPKHAALYEELAPYYNQIYHWKDYRKEASKIRALIHDFQLSTGNDLLDVACGTGRHLSYLRRYFNCMGIDASKEMLRLARENVPGMQFSKGDMLDFDAGRQFDVVLCLFSSIGYLKTAGDVRKALLNFARHLKKGGVLIVEPWLQKSEWRDRTVSLRSYDGDSAKIARVSFAWAKGAFSELDEHYLIGVKRKGVTHVRDLHRLRFFEVEPALQTLRKAGLDVRFTEDSLMTGRGLLIATKPLG